MDFNHLTADNASHQEVTPIVQSKLWHWVFSAKEQRVYHSNAKATVMGVRVTVLTVWLLFFHCAYLSFSVEHIWVYFLFGGIWVPFTTFYLWDIERLKRVKIWRDAQQFKRLLWFYTYNVVIPQFWFLAYLLTLHRLHALSLFELFLYFAVAGMNLLLFVGSFKRVFLFFSVGCSLFDIAITQYFTGGIDAFYWRLYVVILLMLFVLLMLQDRNAQDSLSNKQAAANLVNKVWGQNKKLQQLRAAQNAYLSAASNDLRQPLQSLMLVSHYLKVTNRDENMREVLGRIDWAIESLSHSFDNMLNLSGFDSDTSRLKSAPFPIQPLFQRLYAHFQQAAKHKGIVFRVVDSRAWLLSDDGLLYSILSNLVSNAIEYTPVNGRIVVGLRRGAQGKCTIAVYDTGIGIDDEQVSVLTKDSAVLDFPIRHVRGSVGLGLSVSKRLAQMLNTAVTVRPMVSVGSVFCLEHLPLFVHHSLTYIQSMSASFLHPVVIGLMDVGGDDAAEIHFLLERWGGTVIVLTSLEEARRCYDSGNFFDLILNIHAHDMAGRVDVTLMHQVAQLQTAYARKKPLSVLMAEDTSEAFANIVRPLEYRILYKPLPPSRLFDTLSAWLLPD